MLQLEKAKELLAGASRLISARGKKVVDINLRSDELDDAMIAKLMLGPTGNLRAPTLVQGKTILIGFEEQAYRDLLT